MSLRFLLRWAFLLLCVAHGVIIPAGAASTPTTHHFPARFLPAATLPHRPILAAQGMTCAAPEQTQIPPEECEALVALYHSTDGPAWSQREGWLVTSTPCSWYGVGCEGGHITSLLLMGNGLSGPIPPEAGNLANLEMLWLHGNQLSGAIPPEVGNLANLEMLWLYVNQLSGPIPPELGTLSNLRSLYLYTNQLTGELPLVLMTLPNLQTLHLGDNQLSGPIPSALGNLTSLTQLELGNNQLSGPIPPELGSLSNLQTLTLHNNQLSGELPDELGNLTNLEMLWLHGNQLSGEIPAALGNLSNLQILWLYANQLSGPIPPELGTLSNLESLYLYNNQLSGPIPLSLSSLSSLHYLSLHTNELSGEIPPELANLTLVEQLELAYNRLSGEIPAELGSLSNLHSLTLDNNQLSGGIPDELGNLANLHTLWLHGNQFEGELAAFLCAVASYTIDYNKFSSAAPCILPTWRDTQTIPPSNLSATPHSPTSVQLTWTPIPFNWTEGYYEVLGRATPDKPYQSLGQSATKQETGLILQGPPLTAGSPFCFIVRTFSAAHAGNQNDLTSETSAEVCTILPSEPTPSPTPSPTVTPSPSPTPPSSGPLLALYALAFDTPPEHDLSWGYPTAMEGLQAASAADSNKRVVVLVDMPGHDNTFIYTFQAGQEQLIQGLPDPDGSLRPDLREYDMTDGATLGGFLLWARATYPTGGATTFSYVGHGGPLIPETDFGTIFEETNNSNPASRIFPLPVRVDANPEFTDMIPAPSLLSLHHLSEALQIGSQGGASPFAVVDLVKCMAGTLEEFYALAPYATTLTSAPTYTYFAPEMLGQGLAALSPTAPPTTMATTLVERYDSTLATYDDPATPEDDHPRLLVAVKSAAIPRLKQTLDEVAYYLMEDYDRASLEAAYRQSAHYDTTYCQPQDWEHAVPDALVDLDNFAAQLAEKFEDTPVVVPATTLRVRLEAAILARHAHDGVPWFAPGEPTWRFENHAGIALYADLVGRAEGQERYLSWHAHFYTDTVSITNPHPYAFVQGGFKGVGWADVFNRFWTGVPHLQTAACLPSPPRPADTGELAVTGIPLPRQATVTDGAPTYIVAAVRSEQLTINPTVAFTVTLAGQPVFTEQVQLPYLLTGTHPIPIQIPWEPHLPNPEEPRSFLIEVVVDPDNEVAEENEQDNRRTLSVVVGEAPDEPRPRLAATLADGNPWQSEPTIALNVTQHPDTQSAAVRHLQLQIYQHQAGSDPTVLIPTLLTSVWLRDIDLSESQSVPLPSMVQPGLVTMIVWGWSAGGVSVWQPESVVLFNYIPPNSELDANQNHYFLFEARHGDQVTIGLAVPQGQDANMFAWDPYSFGPPNPTWGIATQEGDDTIHIKSAPFDGAYVLAVYGVTAATYTLSVTHEQGTTAWREPLRGATPLGAIPTRRPTFLAPIPQPPSDQPTAPLTLFMPLVGR